MNSERKTIASAQDTQATFAGDEVSPEELPLSPEERLNYAFAMIQSAVAAKTLHLEVKIQKLKQELLEKDSCLGTMEERVMTLEAETEVYAKENKGLKEENARLRAAYKQLTEENIELNKMRSSILSTLGTSESVAIFSDICPYSSPPAKSEKEFARYATTVNTSKQSPVSLKRSYTPGMCTSRRSSQGPDGKYFFSLTKDRLSPKRFEEFIGNLKRYKNKEVTKAEAIERAREIFGEENEDLFQNFQQLIIS